MRKGDTLNYRLGEIGVNSQNIPMQIVSFRKTNDIDVLFLNGANEIVQTKYDHFKSGKIRCYSSVVGEEKITRHGEKVAVVGIVGNGHQEIIIKYGDGWTMKISRNDYKKGKIPFRKGLKTLHSLISKGIAKEIPNHNGYFADINGNIYNSNGHRIIPQKRGNYLGVDLRTEKGSYKSYLVHRLVLGTFIPNIQCKEEVNHKDGDKYNNSLVNLEWVTRSENQKHRFAVLKHTHMGEHNTCAKLTESDVLKIIALNKNGISVHELSETFNVSKGTIYDILSGRSWVHVSYREGNNRKQVLAM